MDQLQESGYISSDQKELVMQELEQTKEEVKEMIDGGLMLIEEEAK